MNQSLKSVYEQLFCLSFTKNEVMCTLYYVCDISVMLHQHMEVGSYLCNSDETIVIRGSSICEWKAPYS
jgi:hypothetical protein